MRFKMVIQQAIQRFSNNLSNWVITFLTALNFIVFYKVFAKAQLEVNCGKEITIDPELQNLFFLQTISVKILVQKLALLPRLKDLFGPKTEMYLFFGGRSLHIDMSITMGIIRF